MPQSLPHRSGQSSQSQTLSINAEYPRSFSKNHLQMYSNCVPRFWLSADKESSRVLNVLIRRFLVWYLPSCSHFANTAKGSRQFGDLSAPILPMRCSHTVILDCQTSARLSGNLLHPTLDCSISIKRRCRSLKRPQATGFSAPVPGHCHEPWDS